MANDSRNPVRGRPLALLVAGALAGCSSLAPQIFSERLQVQRGADGRYAVAKAEAPLTLEEAYADAAFVQRRYLTAVQEQGNATPQLATGLIGLSALTLFKGVTHPNTTDAAGAGVIGSTTWALGNTLLSRPRLDVYRAGADALGCAMAAVEPLRRATPTLGQPSDGAGTRTLYGAMAAVDEARNALDELLARHAAMAETRVRIVQPAVPETRRIVTERPRCEIPKGTPPARAQALQDECNRQPPRTREEKVPAKPEQTQTVVPEAAVTDAFRRARREIELADGQTEAAQRVVRAHDDAAALLWRKSLAIQLTVSAEVDKTIPDLASVLRAAQGLRDSGFVQTGAKAATTGGQLQGRAPGAGLTDEARAALREIDRAAAVLGRARAQLDRYVRPATLVGETSTREQLNQCSVKTTGVRLQVTPTGDEIAVALGSTAVFFVSGGSGVPGGQVVAGPVSAVLAPKVEGGQFKFEFTPPAGLQPGDLVTLRFTDGAGAASYVVQLRITAADAKAAAPAPAPAASGADTRPAGPVATSLRSRFTDDNLTAFFGLDGQATEAQIATALEACRGRLQIAGPAGSLDAPMLDALRQGRCKA